MTKKPGIVLNYNPLYFRLFVFVLLFLFQAGKIKAQVVVTGSNGANGNHTSLTQAGGAFAAINSNSQAGRNIQVSITGNITTENGAVGLGAGTWTSLKITTTGIRTVSGNVNQALIRFEGSDNVVLDGISITGSNRITINNASTGANAATIQFYNGASNDSIKNVTILGAATGNATGTVHFKRGPAGENNYIVMSGCDIGASSSSTLPAQAIYAEAATAPANSNIEILNNNIYDFFSAASSCNGIYVKGPSAYWTISGNKLFQRAARQFAVNANSVYTGIKVEGDALSPGENFVISGNIIGFSSSASGGLTTITGSDANGLLNKVRGIDIINAGLLTASSIQGNTIGGFTLTSHYNNPLKAEAAFVGITAGHNGTGKYHIGNITANTIGSQSSNTITLTHGGTVEDQAWAIGIYDGSATADSIFNNTIGGISINGSGNALNFTGICVAGFSGTGNVALKNNTIGGSTAAGSINHLQTGLYRCYGIDITNSSAQITSNTIRNFNFGSSKTVSPAFAGIYVSAGTGIFQVAKNQVHSITGIAAAAGVSLHGLLLDITDDNNTVEKNFIHSIEPGNDASVSGITANMGRAIYRNNVVRLGINKLGSAITAPHIIYGIAQYAAANNNSFFHNTVYIGGTGATSNTNSYAFYGNSNGNTRNYSNNNLVNERTNGAGTGTHYAIALAGISGLTSNYNNFYSASTSRFTGLLAAADQTTFNNWQLASGNDNMSVNGNPLFGNATGAAGLVNLAITAGSICNNEALPGLATDDYNNSSRDNSLPVGTPDIGAYELARGTVAGTWIGVIDTDWNKAGNWDNNTIPTASTNVFIVKGHKTTGGIDDMPVIPTGIANCRNLNLLMPYSKVLINNAGQLRVAGAISSKGILDIVNGTIEFFGISGTQSIAGSMFKNNTVLNLIANNNIDLVNLQMPAAPENDTLNITGAVSFKGNNRALNTYSAAAPLLGMLTLKSNLGSAARIADITNNNTSTGNTITGNVTVERSISYGKKWHFLAVPTNASGTQTINAAWQEGNAPMVNSKPGYGTLISNNTTGNGYDFASTTIAFKKLVNNSWVSVGASGTNTAISSADAYMLYIRGDRSVGAGAPAGPTILRTTGDIKMNNISKAVTASTPTVVNFTSVGNPYASAIDLRKLTYTSVSKIVYAWDPSLPGTFGLGAYQTLTFNGLNFIATPGGGAFFNTPTCNYIQSGLAFLVKGTVGTAGTLTFLETAKTPLSSPASRTAAGDPQTLRMHLVSVTGNVMKDGLMAEFDASYANSYDDEDAPKQLNSYENTGIKVGTNILSVERHALPQDNDSIQVYVSNLYNGNYNWVIKSENLALPGLSAYLEDKYTATSVLLNLSDSNFIQFTVDNNAASKANDRFKILFKQSAVLPVHFTGIQAVRNDKTFADISWQTENEINISHYELQKSSDGIHFSSLFSTSPATAGNTSRTYSFTDRAAGKMSVYYRVMAIGNDGSRYYSNIAKLNPVLTEGTVSLRQNPSRNSLVVIDFNNVPNGKYLVRVISNDGKMIAQTTATVNTVFQAENIQLPKTTASGMYRILISGNNKAYNLELIME